MTDHELLELAAKAAGIDVRWERDPSMPFQERWQAMVQCGWGGQPSEIEWHPLREDGQALRLAVKLNIEVSSDAFNGYTTAMGNESPGAFFDVIHQTHGNDPYAATRRAIVRAAAEIGRDKP